MTLVNKSFGRRDSNRHFNGKETGFNKHCCFLFFSFEQDAVVVFLTPRLDVRPDNEQPRYRLLVQNYT